LGRIRSCATARIGSDPDDCYVARLSHKPPGPMTSCRSVTRSRFCIGSFRSRKVRFGRLQRSCEVGEKCHCYFRTTALVCATASRRRSGPPAPTTDECFATKGIARSRGLRATPLVKSRSLRAPATSVQAAPPRRRPRPALRRHRRDSARCRVRPGFGDRRDSGDGQVGWVVAAHKHTKTTLRTRSDKPASAQT
jgi:hypothetical protein